MNSQPVTATPPATAPVATRIPADSPHEDCDRCTGQAIWRVSFGSKGELLFCGHHARDTGFAGEDSHHAYPDAAAPKEGSKS